MQFEGKRNLHPDVFSGYTGIYSDKTATGFFHGVIQNMVTGLAADRITGNPAGGVNHHQNSAATFNASSYGTSRIYVQPSGMA